MLSCRCRYVGCWAIFILQYMFMFTHMFMQEENMDRDENPYLWFIAFWDYVWWMLLIEWTYWWVSWSADRDAFVVSSVLWRSRALSWTACNSAISEITGEMNCHLKSSLLSFRGWSRWRWKGMVAWHGWYFLGTGWYTWQKSSPKSGFKACVPSSILKHWSHHYTDRNELLKSLIGWKSKMR